MSKVFLTCDLTNLTIVNDVPVCTQWEYMTPMFPIFELPQDQLHLIMGATATFLAICYVGRRLLASMNSAANSD